MSLNKNTVQNQFHWTKIVKDIGVNAQVFQNNRKYFKFSVNNWVENVNWPP